MSFPTCPACNLPDTPRIDGAPAWRTVEGNRVRVVLRTYRCPCGASYRTREAVERISPRTLWVSTPRAG